MTKKTILTSAIALAIAAGAGIATSLYVQSANIAKQAHEEINPVNATATNQPSDSQAVEQSIRKAFSIADQVKIAATPSTWGADIWDVVVNETQHLLWNQSITEVANGPVIGIDSDGGRVNRSEAILAPYLAKKEAESIASFKSMQTDIDLAAASFKEATPEATFDPNALKLYIFTSPTSCPVCKHLEQAIASSANSKKYIITHIPISSLSPMDPAYSLAHAIMCSKDKTTTYQQIMLNSKKAEDFDKCADDAQALQMQARFMQFADHLSITKVPTTFIVYPDGKIESENYYSEKLKTLFEAPATPVVSAPLTQIESEHAVSTSKADDSPKN